MLDKLRASIYLIVTDLRTLANNPGTPADLVTVADMLFWAMQADIDTQGARRGIVTTIKLALTDLDACWDWAASRGLTGVSKCITSNKQALRAALYSQYD